MCGIAAVVDPRGTLAPGTGIALAAALRHRGPDGEAVRRLGPLLLVHTRLAIVDVAGGDQPLSSEDGRCTAIVNGEIYNHLELREELGQRGHRFATRSDCEAVVHAYEEWGEQCLDRLNGIFAFALWDEARTRLIVARDPFGVKPLYWWSDGLRFAAASEVRALRATGLVAPTLDEVALQHLLAWRFVPSPRTLLKGVQKLGPASYLVVEGGRVAERSYRRPPDAPLEGSADELAAELRRGLGEAVMRQTMADVPYGVFLSGGLDSAAVLAALRAGDTARVPAFTVGFPGYEGELDETAAAAETAGALGADLNLTGLDVTSFAADLTGCMSSLEEPCGAPAAPAVRRLSELASRSVKVVLSGQGADEALGGYRRMQAVAVLGHLRWLPPFRGRPLRALGGVPSWQEPVSRAAAVLEAPRGLDRLLCVFEIAPSGLREALTGSGVEEAAAERRELARQVLRDVPEHSLLDAALYLDTHVFLPDSLLVYGDKMSMAHGLEHRVPFLDLEFMRFVERLPAKVKMRFGRRKWLYRRSVRGLVPAEVLRRPKHAFTTPYEGWLRSSLGVEVKSRYTHDSGLSEHIAPAVVHRLVEEHRRGVANHKRLLYCLLELALWHSACLEQTVPAQAAAGAA